MSDGETISRKALMEFIADAKRLGDKELKLLKIEAEIELVKREIAEKEQKKC